MREQLNRFAERNPSFLMTTTLVNECVLHLPEGFIRVLGYNGTYFATVANRDTVRSGSGKSPIDALRATLPFWARRRVTFKIGSKRVVIH